MINYNLSNRISPESMVEIRFLTVCLKLLSPYITNSVSGLIFELCLDSTPIVML